MKKFNSTYYTIITTEKLLSAWEVFLSGKSKKPDVILFQARLMDNIFELQHELTARTYEHGGYRAFHISDPKPRIIHKASVRDRLLHHLLYQELYAFFDTKFIYDSYSCRLDKGTHKAMSRFQEMANIVSKNNTKTCWVLKCDIKKFFANIDHTILKIILGRYILDADILCLVEKVIDSFYTSGKVGVGLPLGNLTSQLLVNIYMNDFDQFVKRALKVKYYARFADDFIFLSTSKTHLESLIPSIEEFLRYHLGLELHERKVFMKSLASGIDFLGWVHFSEHRVLLNSTKRRMQKRIIENSKPATIQSYLGMLSHGNARKLQEEIKVWIPARGPG